LGALWPRGHSDVGGEPFTGGFVFGPPQLLPHSASSLIHGIVQQVTFFDHAPAPRPTPRRRWRCTWWTAPSRRRVGSWWRAARCQTSVGSGRSWRRREAVSEIPKVSAFDLTPTLVRSKASATSAEVRPASPISRSRRISSCDQGRPFLEAKGIGVFATCRRTPAGDECSLRALLMRRRTVPPVGLDEPLR
jgi:hypothetical protein